MVASVRELKHACYNRMLSRRRPLHSKSLALSPDAPTPLTGGERVAPLGEALCKQWPSAVLCEEPVIGNGLRVEASLIRTAYRANS